MLARRSEQHPHSFFRGGGRGTQIAFVDNYPFGRYPAQSHIVLRRIGQEAAIYLPEFHRFEALPRGTF
jgi:hypothetical protein